MNIKSDVIVVGGGLHGCSAALHLQGRGISTCILEKDYAGRHASGVNAGGVRTLGRHLSELPLAVKAKELWHSMEEFVGDDCGFRPVGQVRIAETEQELAEMKRRSRQVAELGLLHMESVIGAEEVRDLLPAIGPACSGGLFVAGDGYANPFRTTNALKRRALDLGAQYSEGVEIVALQRSGSVWALTSRDGASFQAPVLVNCAGAWGNRLAAMAGDQVPLVANGSMMMITSRLPPVIGPVVGAVGHSLSLKQFENGTVLIGGGHRAPVNRDRNETSLDIEKLSTAAQTVVGLFPIFTNVQVVRFWSGIEGFTPDSLPIIGQSRNAPNMIHAFGFSAHGFQLGPIVGRVLADLVEHGKTTLPIDAFNPYRFQHRAAA
ncbi:NAD(P)/FAD-dependent oxidoreductase [Roseibium aggregatum]|uniref:NAD(P)/FAD-dependent oxidoreductase n=1 Tax=Roseibium aggregatum TaxID=187304 RepID=UPI0025AD6B2F|nr:FAD-binding oxidoreductase [Roseibium aggregatum]WJS05490.1 FAD-binding oxidoreductase [Roseibium aggregatum]